MSASMLSEIAWLSYTCQFVGHASQCRMHLKQLMCERVVQGLREYQNDTFDDWRNLLEQQEQRSRFEIEGSKV